MTAAWNIHDSSLVTLVPCDGKDGKQTDKGFSATGKTQTESTVKKKPAVTTASALTVEQMSSINNDLVLPIDPRIVDPSTGTIYPVMDYALEQVGDTSDTDTHSSQSYGDIGN